VIVLKIFNKVFKKKINFGTKPFWRMAKNAMGIVVNSIKSIRVSVYNVMVLLLLDLDLDASKFHLKQFCKTILENIVFLMLLYSHSLKKYSHES